MTFNEVPFEVTKRRNLDNVHWRSMLKSACPVCRGGALGQDPVRCRRRRRGRL